MIALEILMRVPIPPRMSVICPRPNLYETYPPFQQPPGHQTISPKILRLLFLIDAYFHLTNTGCRVDAVHFQNVRRFVGEVEHLRCTTLHLGG